VDFLSSQFFFRKLHIFLIQFLDLAGWRCITRRRSLDIYQDVTEIFVGNESGFQFARSSSSSVDTARIWHINWVNSAVSWAWSLCLATQILQHSGLDVTTFRQQKVGWTRSSPTGALTKLWRNIARRRFDPVLNGANCGRNVLQNAQLHRVFELEAFTCGIQKTFTSQNVLGEEN
jgi:hypothetical protein